MATRMNTTRLSLILALLASGCEGGMVGDGSGAGIDADAGDVDAGSVADVDGGGGGGAGDADAGLVTAGTVPPGVLFFDGFDYAVARDATGKFAADGPFVAHGWSGGKDAVLNGSGAGGWLYTSATVVGSNEALPGVDSTHALVVECGAGTFASVIEGVWRQTDFYLQFGNPAEGSLDTIPADVWIQQWMFIADAGNQRSLFPPTQRLGKWFYPTRNGYPSTDLEWLFSLSGVVVDSEVVVGGASQEVHIDSTSVGVQIKVTDTDNDIYTDERPDGTTTLGSSGTDPDRLQPITAGQWFLLRVHVDHTTAPGLFETWIQPRGGDWIKIVDSASTAVDWEPTSADGHRGMRFPTTMSNWYQEPELQTTHGDWWIYIDDFAMARGVNSGGAGVADLPSYATTTP